MEYNNNVYDFFNEKKMYKILYNNVFYIYIYLKNYFKKS